jgi:hypothetical protein
MKLIEEDLHKRIEKDPSAIKFFRDKRLVKHEFSVKEGHIDFVLEDDEYCYLVEMKYKRDPIEAITDLDRKAPLYAAQQKIDPAKIKEVILVDKESYEKRKEDIEYHVEKRGIQVVIYNADDIMGESEKISAIEEPKTSDTEILEKLFRGYTPHIKASLSLLKDPSGESVILGRSSEYLEKHDNEGTLYVGRICEMAESYYGRKVLVDAIQPHKIYICGKTGSGKSFTMGVIAEELASLNMNMGVIIVDPMGVFWSMKFPCREKDFDSLKEWGLQPKGFSNVKVFVPVGFFDKASEGTRDAVFAIRPNELSAEDWCNTFGLDIYGSPQGALLIEVIECLKKGYTAEIDGRQKSVAPQENYTIDNMIECVKYSPNFANKYRSDSVRALVMHLDAAKNWGVFSTKATPIQSLSVANQVSVVDISFLKDYSRALVVGILARKILEERTKYLRYIKAAELGGKPMEQPRDITEIPITWLMVDEAHILAPSNGKTVASEALAEYAKRGRMPGCALVLATQQPYATDDRILSQVDILITHNLSFLDDISAFRARAPSFLTGELSDQGFIRRLPVGAAIIADQSTSSERAFVMYVRPRVSEHAGRIVPPEAFKPKEVIVEEKVVVEEEIPEEVIKAAPQAAPPVPTLFVPTSIVADYLQRFIQYRFIGELNPSGERRFVRIFTLILPEPKRDILGILLGHLAKDMLNVDEVKDVEGTPVIFLSREDAKLVLTSSLSESATIVAFGVSAKVEQDVVDLVKTLKRVLAEFSST